MSGGRRAASRNLESTRGAPPASGGLPFAHPALSPHPEGIVLAVRVVPRAGRSTIAGVRGDALLVRLAAAPVEGAANDALTALLAEALGGSRRDVTILAGHHARDKRVLLRRFDADLVRQRLAKLT